MLPQLPADAGLMEPTGSSSVLRDVPAGRDVDIMLEAKAKDVALPGLREQLTERGLVSSGGRVLVPAV